MQTLEKNIDSFVNDFLIRPEKIWQPTDFLPNSQKDTFIEEVKEIREISKELSDDFWVVSSARSAKFRLQPAASRVSAQYKMLLSYCSRAAACLHAASDTRLLCCCRAFCGLLSASAYSKLTSCASSCRRMLWLLTPTVLRHRHRTYFCVLRSSMLSTAAERRLMVTPMSCLEGRKCSFLLYLLLLFLWHHNQSCSPP